MAQQEGAEGLPARMLAALGVDNKSDIKIIGRDAVSALEKLFSSLNNRHGQRFLFAGDATSTQPFEDPSQLISDVRQMAVTATDAADLQTQLDTYFQDMDLEELTVLKGEKLSKTELKRR